MAAAACGGEIANIDDPEPGLAPLPPPTCMGIRECDPDAGPFVPDAGQDGSVILDDGGASPDSGPAADAADGGPPCELGTFYLDADGDGHGVGSVIATACELPAGFALTSDDCDDTDERAFPGQLGYFSTSRPGGSFDFDCDAKEDKEIVNIDPRYCLCGNGNCSVTRGWKDAVPECGVSQDYSWLPVSSVSCEIAYVTKIQGCR